MERDEYAKELSRYIHLNPVRAKMAQTPGEYLWSSFAFYAGKKASPKWLHRDFILGYFGRKPSVFQREYEKFVMSLVGKDYRSPLGDVIGSVLLGRPDFIEFIKEKFISNRMPDQNLPALRQLAPRASMMSVFEEVDAAFPENTIFSRNLKIYLSRKLTGEQLKTIGTRFGLSESAVSHAGNRAKQQIDQDRKLGGKIRKIEKSLKSASFKT